MGRKCDQSKVAAYTNNPGQANKDITINFCPRFFGQASSGPKLKACATVINQWKNSKIPTNRLDLNNYQCQGYSFLHELFHINALSNVGTQGTIKDLKIRYYNADLGKQQTSPAYSPLFTKALARYPTTDVGRFASTNGT